jgi:hypothetical protein
LLPAKIRRLRDSNHPDYKDKDICFFKRQHEALANCQSPTVKTSKTGNAKATEAPYSASYRTALVGEAHTCAETLIKLHAVEMTTWVLGEPSKKKLETVQLPNNKVKRRIQDLSGAIEKKLMLRLKSSFVADHCGKHFFVMCVCPASPRERTL